jgi:methylenetetrahydrofolate--tRNA-(uracil-5-)-methyltransferase
LAGQIAGLEGYAGNIAGGWLAGVNAARLLHGETPLMMPPETMVGALMHYITHADAAGFQPMKANFGLMPPLATPFPKGSRGKRSRGEIYAARALAVLSEWLLAHPELAAATQNDAHAPASERTATGSADR